MMTRSSDLVKCWMVCLVCAFCASSDAPCPNNVLCPIRLAFSVTVTSSVSGGPVADAYVAGDPYGSGNGELCHQALGSTCCNQAPGSTCYLYGFAGQYTLQIGASGFQSVARSITVAEGSQSCCPSTTPGHLDIALAPIA